MNKKLIKTRNEFKNNNNKNYHDKQIEKNNNEKPNTHTTKKNYELFVSLL